MTRQPCMCSKYEAVNPNTGEVTGTECVQRTARRFAPGHDAKLKSLLIAAGIHKLKVREVGTEQLHTPMDVAGEFGFSDAVEKGIKRQTGNRDEQPAQAASEGKPAGDIALFDQIRTEVGEQE